MKKHRILSFISAFVLGIVILSGAIFGPVSAEEDTKKPAVWLQVSPTSTSITLKPGDKYDGEFEVSNIGSEDFVFKVYASPFSVVGENYDHDYVSEKNYNQIHRWVSFDKTEFTLSAEVKNSKTPEKYECPKDKICKVKVTYHINVPEDVPSGSQHAVLFAESSDNDAEPSGSGIKAISRVGMRLSARVPGETNENVEIIDYDLPTIYISFDGLKITATSKIQNSGNVDAEAKYHFVVHPFFGGDPIFQSDKTNLIYPDSEFRHNVIWENTPLLGLFSVTYSITANSVVKDETRIILVMPAWLLIIIIGLLTFLAIWITLKVKKRRQLHSKMQL